MTDSYYDTVTKNNKNDMLSCAKRSYCLKTLLLLVGNDKTKASQWLLAYNDKLKCSPSTMLYNDESLDTLEGYLDSVIDSGK